MSDCFYSPASTSKWRMLKQQGGQIRFRVEFSALRTCYKIRSKGLRVARNRIVKFSSSGILPSLMLDDRRKRAYFGVLGTSLGIIMSFDRCGTLPCILSTYFYVLSSSRYLVIVLVYINHEKCYLYR